MKKQLHPGARWLFRINVYWLWIIIMIFSGFFFFVRIISESMSYIILIAFLIFGMVIAEIYARMAYNRWFYEFTDTNLKLERGIIWKKYSNIPYERIQNVDITRGIIARIIGFSTLNIQTAGYSMGGKGGIYSEGYIPAVDVNEAEKIRDFLMKKIGKRNKQGL